MPLIDKIEKTKMSQVTCQVAETTFATMKQYMEFCGGTQGYVVNEALKVVFRQDKDFKEWVAGQKPKTVPMRATA